MSSFTHTTTVVLYDDEKGIRRIKPDQPEEFKRLFMRGIPGDRWLVGAKPYKEKHSPQQRGYLRGVVIPAILTAMGMELSKENNDLMYLKMKEKFGPCDLRYGKDGEDGEVLAFPKSAKDYTTTDMHQLIDRIVQWAGEFLGITIPPPQRTMMEGGGI